MPDNVIHDERIFVPVRTEKTDRERRVGSQSCGAVIDYSTMPRPAPVQPAAPPVTKGATAPTAPVPAASTEPTKPEE